MTDAEQAVSEERLRQFARTHIRHEGNRSNTTLPSEELASMANELLRLRSAQQRREAGRTQAPLEWKCLNAKAGCTWSGTNPTRIKDGIVACPSCGHSASMFSRPGEAAREDDSGSHIVGPPLDINEVLSTLEKEDARDTDRLYWLVRQIGGDESRRIVGVLSDTGNISAWREAIDAAIRSQEAGET